MFDELAFFQPRDDNDLYMVDPGEQKGIHCRFGMKGVIAGKSPLNFMCKSCLSRHPCHITMLMTYRTIFVVRARFSISKENHFDGTRNMIAIMKGERRYMLSHPDQCENLALYPKGHPSAVSSPIFHFELHTIIFFSQLLPTFFSLYFLLLAAL